MRVVADESGTELKFAVEAGGSNAHPTLLSGAGVGIAGLGGG
jgi:hypothetical protein